jgi:hypothetical protein
MKIKSEIKELSKEIYETISLLNKFKMQMGKKL